MARSDPPNPLACPASAGGQDLLGFLWQDHAVLRLAPAPAKGVPMRHPLRQLGLCYGHLAQGETGLLDYIFRRYQAEGERDGASFLDWVQGPAYDPAALRSAYRAGGGARLLERLPSRE